MVKRITIIKTRVNKGRSDSGGGERVKSVTDTTEVANVAMSGTGREEIGLENDKLESKMNQRFLKEEVGGIGCVEERKSDGLMILKACYAGPIRRNSVLEELRLRQLDDIQEDRRDIVDSKSKIAVGKFLGLKRDEELSIICTQEV